MSNDPAVVEKLVRALAGSEYAKEHKHDVILNAAADMVRQWREGKGKAVADAWRDASPWVPMNEPKDIKAIGKLMEELGECVSACARALIQGMDEAEPVTGKVNKKWVSEELADVWANMDIVMKRFEIAPEYERVQKKKRHITQWMEMLP